MTARRTAAAAALVLLTLTGRAAGQEQSTQEPAPAVQSSGAATTTSKGPSAFTRTLVFFGGAAAGLGVHELGHVVVGASFDANPSVKPIHYGPIPFFAIDHDPVSRRQEFAISSAGLWFQQGTSEWLLTARPDLRNERAPFLKGYLAFHVATSMVYGIAAFAEIGPPERDTLGMASTLGKDGIPEPVIGALVIAPGLLDAYRYRHPRAKWAVWASRGVKITGVVLTAWAGK